MKLIKAVKTRCEMGTCKEKAIYTIKLDRIGIRSRINICEKCLSELYCAIGEVMIPRSIETTRKKSDFSIKMT